MLYIFRVDSSIKIATGHVMRCLTLAKALRKDEKKCLFICRNLEGNIINLIKDNGFAVNILPRDVNSKIKEDNCNPFHYHWLETSWEIDANQTVDSLPNDDVTLIIDCYALDHKWQKTLRPYVNKIVVIDDLADRKHDCDVIIDQNLYHNYQNRYDGLVPNNCDKLLGLNFLMLREEFATLPKIMRSKLKNIFISFGGVDSKNYTEESILAVIGAQKDLDVKFNVTIVGCNVSKQEKIEKICDDNGLKFYKFTDKIAQLMAESDLAIGAGGTTTWERCVLGLPSLTYVIADNQKQLVIDSAEYGILLAPNNICKNHIISLYHNQLLLEKISNNCLNSCDSNGTKRIVQCLTETKMEVIEAKLEDSRTIYDIRNQESVRAKSHNKDPLIYENHLEWYGSFLEKKKGVILIAKNNHSIIGYSRFDFFNEEEAMISICLSDKFMGKGMGKTMLLLSEKYLKNKSNIKIIKAEILEDNQKSHNLFIKSGYQKVFSTYNKSITG